MATFARSYPVSKPNSQSSLWNWFWTFLWLTATILLILKFVVYQQVTVVGASMEPNYYTGELLLVNQVNRTFQRGQVVAVYSDKEVAKNADYFTRFRATFFLKRVVGLPNEEIEMIGGKVIIYNSQNPEGKILVENYINPAVKQQQDNGNYYFPRTQIPDKHYFLLGDNRTNSTDSRVKGAFPDYAVFGQETLRFWPIPRREVFDIPPYTWEDIDQVTQSKVEEIKQRSKLGLEQPSY